mmetsp:Transcript_23040/g.42443  ORF Transcript_23040/g.42443 Transcript_23040/m.42443 type:complete len:324 (+) Transcript_23040:845-1816(+)
MLVRQLSALNGGELAPDAGDGFEVAWELVYFVSTCDGLHPHNHCSSANHAHLLEALNLFLKVNWSLLHNQSFVPCELHQHHVCGRLKNCVGLWSHVSAVMSYADKVANGELLNVLLLSCIQVQGCVKAVLVCNKVHRLQVRCIVACCFHPSQAPRGCSIMSITDNSLHPSFCTLSEVASSGQHGHKESVLSRQRSQAKHLATREEQWPHVHGGTMAIGWDILLVSTHSLLDSSNEHLSGNLRHEQLLRTLLHASSIESGVHDPDLAILALKRLQALEAGDTIVEGCRIDVHQLVRRWHEHAFVPLSICPGEADVTVHVPDGKA